MYFSQVVGHEDVKKRLVASVCGNQMSHAQLFAGHEGLGGLALAIAYARYLHCSNRGEFDGCGVCPSCKKMDKLAHPDLHFVFPVVKTGTKEVISDDYLPEFRSYLLSNAYPSLIEWFGQMSGDEKSGMIYTAESDSIVRKLSLKSYEGGYKVMIIWYPEKMHVTCSNKLLKTLEEPAPNTLILMVSSDPNELMLTILSRLQMVRLLPLGEVLLANELTKRFGLTASDAQVYAKLSNGNYIKALEQIKESETKRYFFESFSSMMRLAYSRDIAKILEWVEGMAKNSRDRQKNFLLYALSMIRENFIMNFGNKDIVYLTPSEDGFSQKFHPFINERNVAQMMEEFNLAFAHIDQNGNGKIVFFDTVLRLAAVIRN